MALSRKRDIRVDWPTFAAIKELGDKIELGIARPGEMWDLLRSVGIDPFEIQMGLMGPEIEMLVKPPYFEWREIVLARASYCRPVHGDIV